MRALILAANEDPALQRVFSTYAANTPTVFLKIDRDKAQVLGIPIDSIFSALQASLGSAYVNDFNVFGRTWQVNIQAEAPTAPASTTSTASMSARRRATSCRSGRSPRPASCSGRRPSSATTMSAA